MAEDNNSHQLRVGEFFVSNNIITQHQLDEALVLQKDNQERLIGEILVTQGVLSKEQLVMALEMFLMITGDQPCHIDEWLDQEEVDMIAERINEQEQNNKIVDK